ncbi:MAG: beta-ketoacyl-ACP synthase II [Peptoniphilaceae bacterium]
MSRVVITGLGFVSPLGSEKEELIKNLRNGKNGISEITLFDKGDLKVKFAAECKDFNFEDYFSKKELKRMDRVNTFGVIAARKAIEDSEINLENFNSEKVGVMVSSGIGGLGTLEKESFKAYDRGLSRISPFFIPMVIGNMTSAQIAIDLKIHGYVGCPVTACAGSSNAILDGYRSIKDGYNEVVLVGGAEASINSLGIGGFASMKALSESQDINRTSIPFDKERNGFVMGEGGAILVLESLDSAKSRKAKIYGEIVGASMTTDASHITAPDHEGKYAALSMKNAIYEKGYSIEDVDYINAHGTSTFLNDKIETLAIKKVFGVLSKNINISSTKSMTGHLLGASGSLELIITSLAMEESFIPPTINYKVFDPDCDLNISPNKAIEKEIKMAISNSLGFGGHNVCIAIRRYEDEV